MVFFQLFPSLPSPPHDLFPSLPFELLIRSAKAFNILPYTNAVCFAFYARQKQLTTSDHRKTGWSHSCFQLSEKEMEVRGVLFAIETEGKKRNSTFSLGP